MLRPTLLLGLGDFGARVAVHVAESTATREPTCVALVGTLTMTGSGFRTHPRTSDRESNSESTSAPPEAGTPPPDEAVGPVPTNVSAESEDIPLDRDTDAEEAESGSEADADVSLALEETLTPGGGALSANLTALREKQEEIAGVMLREVSRIRDHAAIAALEREGKVVADSLVVLVFAPLSDAVASTALSIILEALDELTRGALFGLPHEIQLVLFAPDLLAFTPRDVDHARAYVALQELEALVDGVDGRPMQVDGAWLFSRRSAADRFVSADTAIYPVLDEHAWHLLRGGMEVESVSGPSTHQTVEGKTTRYSTFGCSRLRFPRDELVEAAASLVVAEELRGLPQLAQERYPADGVYADAADLVDRSRLVGLPELLAESEEGVPLLRQFHVSATEARGTAFVRHLESVALEYRSAENEAQRAVSLRNEALARRMREFLVSEARSILENRAGTLAGVHAAFAAALHERSPFIRDEPSQPPRNVRSALEALEERFEMILFEESRDQDALVEAYLRDHPEAPRGRRRLFTRLQRDEGAATQLLHERLDRVARVRGELEALAAGTLAFSMPGGDAYQELHRTELERQLRTAEEGVAACHTDLERLRPVLEGLREDVAALDRAIQNPIVRWELIETQETRLAARIREAQDAYVATERETDEARERATDLRIRLWIWISAATAAMLAGALATMLYLPDWRLAAGAALLIGGGAFFAAWKRAAVPFLAGRHRLAELEARCQREREALIVLYREVADTRFLHLRFGHVIDWARWLPDHLRELAGRVLNGLKSFGDTVAAEDARAAGWEPAPDFFLELLRPAGGIETLLLQREDVVRSRMADFWRTRPFVTEAPRLLDGTLSVPELVDALREQARGCFADLRAKTADEFFATEVSGGADRKEMVSRLFRLAAPFAKPAGAPIRGQAMEQAFAALTSEPSAIRETMLTLGYSPIAHLSTSEQEVTVTRVACGLAAFQLSTAAEGRRHLQKLDENTRRSVYADPNLSDHLPDLFPTDTVPAASAPQSEPVPVP